MPNSPLKFGPPSFKRDRYYMILRRWRNEIAAAALAVVVLGPMLLPGYILTLDMVFAPSFHFSFSAGDFINSAPLWLLLQYLYIFLPGWVVQKLMLVVLFFSIPYLSLRFLPVPQRFSTRLFAALVYTLNPFVYARMLAGQWAHLLAYALL